MSPPLSARERRRSTRAHQCPTCRQFWALRLIDHPAGFVLKCRYCGYVRRLVILHSRPSSVPGD